MAEEDAPTAGAGVFHGELASGGLVSAERLAPGAGAGLFRGLLASLLLSRPPLAASRPKKTLLEPELGSFTPSWPLVALSRPRDWLLEPELAFLGTFWPLSCRVGRHWPLLADSAVLEAVAGVFHGQLASGSPRDALLETRSFSFGRIVGRNGLTIARFAKMQG